MSEQRIYETTHSVTNEGARNGTRLVPRNTVLVVVRGMSLAKECRVSLTTRESTFNQDVKSLSLSPTVDPLFVFHYLRSQRFTLRDAASEAAHGTKKLDMPVLEQWPFPDIPLPTQRKIAAILAAYDDLIETNRLRIALLEGMAEELYREWFVRMRFPGHQKTEFKKGIPASWTIQELRERADVNPSNIGRGDRPQTIHYIDIGSVTTNRVNSIETLPLAEAPGRARRRVEHGDSIWSSVRPGNRAYALIYEPEPDTIASTGFAVVRPNAGTPFTFLHQAVTTNGFVDLMTAVAKGSAYPATSFEDFERAKLLFPTDELLEQFHTLSEPLHHSINIANHQARGLTRARDLLLPRLISGKLSVEDLDIQFPPSMQEEATEPDPAHA